MATFAASSAKLFRFVENLGDKLQTPTRMDDDGVSATEVRFLGKSVRKHHHHHHAAFKRCFSSSLSVSLLHRNTLLPVPCASTNALSETQTFADDEGIQTNDATQFKTVHVKFQLQRECSFGQQFLMVGDDPMFGLWDPLNAIPLNWSEGHVWAVEMDIPCDKVINYKFILKGGDNSIFWQPGPDRVLQTWETGKTIIVCEDWDNAQLQSIKEEDVFAELTESTEDSQVLIATEDSLQSSGQPESYSNEETSSKIDFSQPTKNMVAEISDAVVAQEYITGQNGEKEVEANGYSGAMFTPKTNNFATLEMIDCPNTGRSSSMDRNLDSAAAVPLLVPGLTPIATSETEEASFSKADKHIRADSSLNAPEPNTKEEPGTDLPKYETEKCLNDELKPHDEGHVQAQKFLLFEERYEPDDKGVEDCVLDNDMQWGRRTLQQFLMNLGLF